MFRPYYWTIVRLYRTCEVTIYIRYRLLYGDEISSFIILLRVKAEYQRINRYVSDERYLHIYILIPYFHPKNDDVRQDLVRHIVTCT